MKKAELETMLRNEALDVVMKALEDHFDADTLLVNVGTIAIPVTDAEKNEKFVVVKVSTPRGTRNAAGTYDPYDGYAAAEDYQIQLDMRATKKAETAEKNRIKEEEKARKKAAKETIKKLNKDGLNKMIHEPEEAA